MSVILKANRGTEVTIDVKVTKDNSPFDLTGSRVHFALKDSLHDEDPPLIKKSTIFGGVTILNAKTGDVRIFLTSADTQKLPNLTKHYAFDVKVREPDGSIFTVLCGEIVFKASVSDASVG